MSKKLKGVRLESNWDTFQTEHPEVKLAKDCNGKILSFSLPEDYNLVSLIKLALRTSSARKAN